MIPKPLRDALGIQAGQLLELEVRDGRLEIEAAPVEMQLQKRRNGPVAVPKQAMPTLTADLVRETLERGRR